MFNYNASRGIVLTQFCINTQNPMGEIKEDKHSLPDQSSDSQYC